MNRIVFAALVAAAAFTGCKWTEFDDLSNTTWARSTQKPDVPSSDWGVALVGLTQPGSTSGGTLGVIGNGDTPTYSVLSYDSGGNSSSSGVANLTGGSTSYSVIVPTATPPVFATDGKGNAVLVAPSVDSGQTVVDVFTPGVNTPKDNFYAAAASPDIGPDAAVFSGDTMIVSDGNFIDVFQSVVASPSLTLRCIANDATGNIVTGLYGLAADDKNLYAWTTAGALFSYSLATIMSTCTAPSANPPALIASAQLFTSSPETPVAGAMVAIFGTSTSATEYAVLGSHKMDKTGFVYVVDLRTNTQVGTTIDNQAELVTFAPATFDGKSYIAFGFPGIAVGSTENAGQVALHELDTTTGALDPMPAEGGVLNDDQPDADEQFGRAITTMQYNGSQILVVAASNEIFAYINTLLYPPST